MRRLGRWELRRELGRGGMGVVYLAHDPRLGREVALKLLPIEDAGEVDLARFEAEGRAAAAVRHPNVLTVHELGQAEGCAFLTMEVARGGSLRDRLRREGTLDEELAADLVAGVAEGVAALHRAQLVHRDLKPENVLFAEDGRPLLADLGLARVLDRQTRLTQTGALVGTPAYMAPEQAKGERERIGPPTDVYGLGALLYECLTGEPPFSGPTMLTLLDAIVSASPRPPSALRPGLDRRLDALCLRCLAKDPQARYPDAAALGAALRGWSEGRLAPPPGAGRALRVAAALSAAALLLLVAVAALGPRPRVAPAMPAQSPSASPTATQAASSPPPRPTHGASIGAHTAGDLPRLRVLDALPLRLYDEPASIRLQVDAPDRRRPLRVLLYLTLAQTTGAELLTTLRELVDVGGERRRVLALAELTDAAPGRPLELFISPRQVGTVDFTRLALVVWDGEGRALSAPLPLPVDLGPEWFRDLPIPAQRPRRVPPGVRPLPTRGEYENAREGSCLVWVAPGGAQVLDGAGRPTPERLGRGCFLGKHEVSVAQLLRFRRERREPGEAPRGGVFLDTPTNSGWFEAQAYCAWAGARLPSELEWSRAAFGDDPQVARAWRRASLRSTQEGGEPAPCGALHMLDNLREFVAELAEGSAPRPPDNDRSEFRTCGGDFDQPPRRGAGPALVQDGRPVGFRIAVDAEGSERGAVELSWTLHQGRFTPAQPGTGNSRGARRAPTERELHLLPGPWETRTVATPWPLGSYGWPARLPGAPGLYLRGEARCRLAAGTWRLATLSDDGVRVALRLDGAQGALVIDRWTHHVPTNDVADLRVERPAEATFVLEYCNIDGDLERGAALAFALYPGD
ncbi:MAG: bifunctional serine/threonine-protein kinase/formylglycine-generating enzyme family protein [Planctomycetota bacterium]